MHSKTGMEWKKKNICFNNAQHRNMHENDI